jgi:hypothetical protein
MRDLGWQSLAGVGQHGKLSVAQGAGNAQARVLSQPPQRGGHQERRDR